MSATATTYRITLTPLNTFFFGGENTFGEDNVNYLVKSNYYPQQTSLLGFLRHRLLIQHGLLGNVNSRLQDSSKANAQELVGNRSFSPKEAYDKNQYGLVKSISPVFLLYQKDAPDTEIAYWQAPLHEGINPKEKSPDKPLQIDAWCLCIEHSENKEKENRQHKPLYVLRNANAQGDLYLAKNALDPYLLGTDGSALDYEKVFLPTEKIGINRPANHKPHTTKLPNKTHGQTNEEEQEGGFYKQTAYRLAKGFSFAFYATLAEPLQNGIVYMGAERSAFMMQVEETTIPDNFGYSPKIKGCVHSGEGEPVSQIVLIADAFVEADIYNHCLFAITQTVPFRYLKTNLQQTKRYYNVSGENTDAMQKSEKYWLLKRGSVLFVAQNQANKVKQHLENYKNFRQIGYNHFVIF